MNKTQDVDRADMTSEELKRLMARLGLSDDDLWGLYKGFLSELKDPKHKTPTRLTAKDIRSMI
jgi:hypothetical protein